MFATIVNLTNVGPYLRLLSPCVVFGTIKCLILTHINYRPLSRRLDRCDRVIQDEVGDSIRGNVKYVTMLITFVTRKFGNVERNSHCDVLHIAPVRVANLVLDCNGVFAIKAYGASTYPGVRVNLPRIWGRLTQVKRCHITSNTQYYTSDMF